MDISSQFNIKKMLTLDKEGLLSVDGFTKAYKKLADKGKIVITDEQVARSAEKLYGGKQNILEGDIKDLAGNVKNARATVVAMNSYFSFLTSKTYNEQIPCHITDTNEDVHIIIQKNITLREIKMYDK